jgi:hypothetical protein
MGTSYIALLTAFYVDNGKNLPLWSHLPNLAYWLIRPGFAGGCVRWRTALGCCLY